MRLVCLSDTHTLHGRVAVPEGDVLVHAGDFTATGTLSEVAAFARWLGDQPHRHKILVAGNHDRLFEANPPAARELLPADVIYLEDAGVELGGLRFWGSPWQPEFMDWAFNLPRGRALREKWDLVPAGVDVLITHGPPFGIMDALPRFGPVGCEELRAALGRIRPRVHVFGHIHEGYGQERRDGVLHVNAAICDGDYRVANAPIVVDLEPLA